MSTSACPMCAEPIAAGTAKCPHCGEFLAGRTVEPPPPAPPSFVPGVTFLGVEELKIYRSLTAMQAAACLAVAAALAIAGSAGAGPSLRLALIGLSFPWLAGGLGLFTRKKGAIWFSILVAYGTLAPGVVALVLSARGGWIGCLAVSWAGIFALALHGHRLLRVAGKLGEMGIDPAVHPKRLVRRD